jgi:DNA-binding response OmpR family regulator
MARVLVVDSDISAGETTSRYLLSLRHIPALANTGVAALNLIEQFNPHVTLVELGLPDISGLDVVRSIRATRPTIACILVTAFGTYDIAAAAVRCGVCDLGYKPLTRETLSTHIAQALRCVQPSFVPASDEVGTPATRRWASAVVRAIAAPDDPRTISDWGRDAAISPGALRNWCRTARLSPRRSLLFLRVLRAVHRHANVRTRAEDALDIVDHRTLRKLMALCGSDDGCLPATVTAFLECQTLIPDPRAVAVVRAELGRILATDADGRVRPSARPITLPAAGDAADA